MRSMLLLAIALVVVLALFGSVSVMGVSAQGPTETPTPAGSSSPGTTPTPAAAPPAAAAGTNVDDPAKAVAIASQAQSVPANSVQWYKFDYTSLGQTFPRPTVTIRMLNAIPSGATFEVYSPENLAGTWYLNPPVGRGTEQFVLDCTNADTTVNLGNTHCDTTNLSWTGGFGLDGTYYVRVINNSNTPFAPQLIFGGPGLANCQNPSGTGTSTATNTNPSPGQPSVQVQCTPS